MVNHNTFDISWIAEDEIKIWLHICYINISQQRNVCFIQRNFQGRRDVYHHIFQPPMTTLIETHESTTVLDILHALFKPL